MDKVIVEYERLPIPDIPDLDNMLSSTDFVDRIILRLVSEPKNREMIAGRDLLNHVVVGTDLTCLFYAKVISDESTTGSIAITQDLFDKYLLQSADAEELYNHIVANTPAENLLFEPINTVIGRIIGENHLPMMELPDGEISLYVLSNK